MARSRLRVPAGYTRRTFRHLAKPIKVALDGVEVGTAVPRENTTGSLGYRCDTKLQIKQGGYYVWAQVTVQVTLIGSKDVPDEPEVKPG